MRGRCGVVLCPRCSRHKGAKHYRKLLQRMMEVPLDRVWLLTFSLGGDTLIDDATRARQAFALLRAEPVWQEAIESTFVRWEYVGAEGQARRWNIHAHAVVVVRAGRALRQRALQRAWRELIGERRGRVHAKRVTHTPARVADYVTKGLCHTKANGRDAFLDLDDSLLLELARFLPYRLHYQFLDGWRARRRRSARPGSSPTTNAPATTAGRAPVPSDGADANGLAALPHPLTVTDVDHEAGASNR
ncbi:MAG: hypothetical protein ACHREM_17690 [Polyangiales bacterium]